MRDRQGRWVPGTSGNPNGRPPSGESLAERIRETGGVVLPDGASRMEAMCAKLWELAEAGSIPAIRLIFEYLEGRPLPREPEPREGMPPFTADEAAEAERRLREWQAEMERDSAGALFQLAPAGPAAR